MVYQVNALSTNPNKIDSPGPTMWKENSLQVVLWAVCALWCAFSHTKWSSAKNSLSGKLRHIAHGMHCEYTCSFPLHIRYKHWVHFLSWTPVQRFCCREWAWQSNSSTCDWQEHFTLMALWLLSVQKAVWWFVVVMIVSWSQQVSLSAGFMMWLKTSYFPSSVNSASLAAPKCPQTMNSVTSSPQITLTC